MAGLTLMLAAGCAVQRPNAPIRTYPGPERPVAEVAVVECGFSARILAIDGDDRFLGQALRDRFTLLPGRHSFRVILAPSRAGADPPRQQARTVSFRLEAGHVYDISVFDQPVDGRRWGIVVADRTRGTDILNPYLAGRPAAP